MMCIFLLSEYKEKEKIQCLLEKTVNSKMCLHDSKSVNKCDSLTFFFDWVKEQNPNYVLSRRRTSWTKIFMKVKIKIRKQKKNKQKSQSRN